VATILEVLLSLGLFALLSYGTWQSIDAVQAGTRLEAGRIDLVLALSQARRLAYLRQTSVLAAATEGDGEVLLVPDTSGPMTLPLTRGVALAAVPARGGVLFHPSGWAENATFELASSQTGRPGRRRVVVNQRGRIR
jgi:type II secretory pathway component PulJ